MRFLRFVLSSANRTRGLLIPAVATGALSGAGSVALLALINQTLRRESTVPLTRLGLLFAAVCLLVTASRVASQYFLVRMGQDLVKDLRLRLSRRILASPLARLEELGPHRLLATLTDDVNAITQALVFIPVMCISGTIVLGCLGYLAWLDPSLFLLLITALVVGILTYQFPARLGIRRFREARRQEDAMLGFFRGLSEGVKELKLHRRRRGAFVERLESTLELMLRLRVDAVVIYGIAAAWGHLLFLAAIGVLLYASPSSIDAGRDTLVGYTVVLLYLMGPLQTFLDSFPTLGRANAAVEAVSSLGLSLQEEPEAGAASTSRGTEVAAPAWRLLQLEGAVHTYYREGQDSEFTLGPINLTLAPGELVFLIGGNGSGKTTLAKLLVGLYTPKAGEVWLDGRRIQEADRDDYRQLFSVVFSDFYLFDRLLGLETPDLDDQARHYLAELRIDHKVDVRDGRLSTTDLSAGQRKRLALLTAYLEDRPIYLFDEWAADQDPMFKEVFYHSILAELKRRSKAVVVISHDDRYFHLADRVLELEDGSLRYVGPYRVQPGRTQREALAR